MVVKVGNSVWCYIPGFVKVEVGLAQSTRWLLGESVMYGRFKHLGGVGRGGFVQLVGGSVRRWRSIFNVGFVES